MSPNRPSHLDEHISRISTHWFLVFQAHQGRAEATAAQAEMLQRYSGAVYRYLLGALRDPDAAEEMAQELVLRLIRGDFRRASPERGRFRDYLKTALVHLVTDYLKARLARPQRLSPDAPEPAAPALDSVNSRADFVASWREELLERTWKALAQFNRTYHATLLLHVTNADKSSAQMAQQLTVDLGKPLSAALVRKVFQRVRGKFADLLLDEVAGSLEDPTSEELRKELAELDLLRYCRSTLERRDNTQLGEK